MAQERIRVLVHGRVQGVGFRAWTRQAAEMRRLTGWCRNRSSGAVEVLAAGASEDLRRFLADLEEGPSLAAVDRVERIDIGEDGGEDFAVLENFEIRPTA
ncbi:acylphosphatase [Fulvimarina endophytica]|uniref:Acylphosphatase n=1 Tax=Fulvimarina endophytica TaxID=2293836 RepID=A0A371X8D5_9HYPH|nr:acylphosphatase [Fulvimarina endophytica]RFC65495.1 acylphosphatase [Fulvimarina endophytica]